MADDAAGFEAWYRSRYQRLVLAVTVIAGSRTAAEDVAAEAFARAWERWPKVQTMASPDAWVFRVAQNEVRSRWRRLGVERRWLDRQPRSEAAAPADTDPELWAAVQALPERTRTAVALRYLGDLTQDEVADVMGVAPGTVAASLHAGRSALRSRLTAPEDDDARTR